MSVAESILKDRLPMKLRVGRWIVIGGVVGVIAILLLGDNTVAAKIVQCAPFIVVMPGLILRWFRSYSWLALMILLYFILAVTGAMAPNANWVDTLMLTLTVLVFFSAVFCSRWLQQDAPTQPSSTDNQSFATPTNASSKDNS